MSSDSVEANPKLGPEMVVHIRPPKRFTALGLRDIWQHRELLYQMATRDFRARYKQSLMGKFWVVLQPMMSMAIYYIVFGLILKLQTKNVPFPLFLLGGILMWQLISGTAQQISLSLVGNAALMKKIYFPRLLVPFSRSLAALVDFFFAFLVLVGFMIVLGVYPTWWTLLAPVFVALSLLVGLSIGLWLAPLYVQYRDIAVSIPIILQLLMYLSGVFYSPEIIPERFRELFWLNPAASIIQGFRWTMLGDHPPDPACLWGIGLMIVMFCGGLYYFRSREAEMADNL
jgi:lipopolysaccharide transport system permease protein